MKYYLMPCAYIWRIYEEFIICSLSIENGIFEELTRSHSSSLSTWKHARWKSRGWWERRKGEDDVFLLCFLPTHLTLRSLFSVPISLCAVSPAWRRLGTSQFEDCNLRHSFEFVLNPMNDRFHESRNWIGYLVTHRLLGGCQVYRMQVWSQHSF